MYEYPIDEFKSFDDKLFLIDFGISYNFKEKNGIHKPLSEIKKFKGNLLFCTVTA